MNSSRKSSQATCQTYTLVTTRMVKLVKKKRANPQIRLPSGAEEEAGAEVAGLTT